jgi:hypothetical protein
VQATEEPEYLKESRAILENLFFKSALLKRHIIKEDTTKYVTPLYATQAEGMMSVGVIFDVKDPDNIAHFLTENLAKCDECHHTKTISLMKPVFFPIPKNDQKHASVHHPDLCASQIL